MFTSQKAGNSDVRMWIQEGDGWDGGGVGGVSHFERQLSLAKDPEEKAGTIKVTGEMTTKDISQNSTDDYHDISDLDSETQFKFFARLPKTSAKNDLFFWKEGILLLLLNYVHRSSNNAITKSLTGCDLVAGSLCPSPLAITSLQPLW